ncbi:MAG: hypothetical protein CME70_19365 [Halobacteriovorax sp.]|nr:hypothetical protein [Halobacteriovorax sp.]MBK26166.1 hypothetical protein [Halobacteriovorax sp.]|tara:strand:- start:33 stop:737 length:705 start_codon:yes stop_codon:yes gene_type:complete
MKRGKVVVVEGIIGAGKSSFSKELAEALGDNTLYLREPDEKDNGNPYLSDFYDNQERWAFTMQTHLLQERFKMHLHAQWHAMTLKHNAVLDRSYFGDTAFARLQVKTGAMTMREFQTYQSIYHAMTASVLLPNVCVHLLVSPEVSSDRIQRRMEERLGRKCESAIDLSYLYSLQREENHMVDTLRQQGVQIISIPWDEDRSTPLARAGIVGEVANNITTYQPADMFLDLHRRTV